MRIGLISSAIVGIAATWLCVPIASGQATIGISAVAEHLDHELLGTMTGGTAWIEWRSPVHRWTFALSANRLASYGRRTTGFCYGFPPPGADCSPQPVRDESKLTGAAVGVGATLYSTPRIWVSVNADVPVSVVHVDTRSLTTRSQQPISTTFLGVRGGMRAGWAPFRKLPLAVETAATVGTLHRFLEYGCYDCYDPFNSSLITSRAQIGVAIRTR